MRSSPPLTFRWTGFELHQVGTAAGPLGGDHLRLDLVVAPGAQLTVRGVAASMVHPGPSAQPSSMELEVDVGEGASLRWLTPPTILVRGCDHAVTTKIRLAPSARLLWREVVVLGREREATGSLLQRLRVDVDGRPLLRNDLTVGPRWPGSLGPAGTDGARAVGTVIGVGDVPNTSFIEEGRLAWLPLDDRSVLVTALGASPGALERALRT